MAVSEIIDEKNVTVNGQNNQVLIYDQGGVVTNFAGVQEIYQLTEKEAHDLKDLLVEYEAHATSEHGGLLNHIPAPKIIDLSVAMTRGELNFKNPHKTNAEIAEEEASGEVKQDPPDFIGIKEEFESNREYIGQYATMYKFGIDDGYKEPNTFEEFMQDMAMMKDKMNGHGDMMAAKVDELINDTVQPETVQKTEFASGM